MPFLADALASDHIEHGQPKNLHIEPKAAMIYIPNIKIEFFLPCQSVPAVDLRPSGNARLDPVAFALVRIVARQILRQ